MLRVLVVDESRDGADSLALLLVLWGHDARACFTAEEALALAPSFRPQVAVVEPRLRGAGGLGWPAPRCRPGYG
jgi:two-component system, sensor histidine kinase